MQRTRNRAPSRTNSKKSFKPFRKDRRAAALLSINSRSTDTHMSFISLISRRATTMSIFVPRVRAALIWHKGNQKELQLPNATTYSRNKPRNRNPPGFVAAEVTGSRLNGFMVCSNRAGGVMGALGYYDAVGEREGWRSASAASGGGQTSPKGGVLPGLVHPRLPASIKSLLRWWSMISLSGTRTAVGKK